MFSKNRRQSSAAVFQKGPSRNAGRLRDLSLGGQRQPFGGPGDVPDPRCAIVLSGGSTKGAFEVGALSFLYRQPGGFRVPGIICGTSVGALNASVLAQGGLSQIDQLEQIWLGLGHSNDMFYWQHWLADIAAHAPNLEPTIESHMIGNVVGDAVGIAKGSLVAFGIGATGGSLGVVLALGAAVVDALDIIDAVEIRREATRIQIDYDQGQHVGSLFNLLPIARLAVAQIQPGEIAKSGIKLRMPITNLVTGRVQYVDENGVLLSTPTQAPLDGDPIVNTSYEVSISPSDGVMSTTSVELPAVLAGAIASASLPVLFQATWLDTPGAEVANAAYVDGGVGRNFDVGAAYALGAQNVYAISTYGWDLPLIEKDYWTPQDTLERVLDITVGQMTSDAAAGAPGGWTPAPHYIQPMSSLAGGTAIDPGQIRAGMAYGFMRAADTLQSGPTTLNPATQATNSIYELRMAIQVMEIQSLLFKNLLPYAPSVIEGLLPWTRDEAGDMYSAWAVRVRQLTSDQIQPVPVWSLLWTSDDVKRYWLPSYQNWYDDWWKSASGLVLAIRGFKQKVHDAVFARIQAGAPLPDPNHWAGTSPDPHNPWDWVSVWWTDWEAHPRYEQALTADPGQDPHTAATEPVLNTPWESIWQPTSQFRFPPRHGPRR